MCIRRFIKKDRTILKGSTFYSIDRYNKYNIRAPYALAFNSKIKLRDQLI